MTNFIQSQMRFTLHSENTESYAWAWEGVDRSASLKHIAEDGNDIVSYASGWAWELSNACISQIDENGERGFTAAEIAADLIDDREFLAAALQAWLEGSNEPEGDDEPEDDDEGDDEEPARPAEQGLLLCTSSLGGRGITPSSPIYIFSDVKDFRTQNPQWHWVQLPDPRWHGVTIIDIDLPVEGGYKAEWGGNPTRKSDGYTYYPY